tara:strand:- start:13025 stop:13510 length:486 start_codon:yes stop_codon:yes gene_type:complete
MAILETNQMMFTAFEPKLQNRFLMEIDGIPAYLIKKIARPSVEFSPVVLDHINVKRKIKGKANWADISCDLYDPVTPSGAQAVMEWVRLSHESVTGRDGYSDFYKKDIYIRTLGPVGDVVEEWILKGAYCSSANFGDMSWDSDSPANISMTIVMDYAILNY